MQLETILCKFGQICVTGNALMLLETTLCEFGQICATGNAPIQLETILCEIGRNVFECLTVGKTSNLNFPAKIRTGMCRALLCGDC